MPRSEIVAVQSGKDIYPMADCRTGIARVEKSILHEGAHYVSRQYFGKHQEQAYTKVQVQGGCSAGLQDKRFLKKYPEPGQGGAP